MQHADASLSVCAVSFDVYDVLLSVAAVHTINHVGDVVCVAQDIVRHRAASAEYESVYLQRRRVVYWHDVGVAIKQHVLYGLLPEVER